MLQKDEYNVQTLLTHGTAVGSLIIGAKDGSGMHGVAYDARIVSFAVALNDDEECDECYTIPKSWQTLASSDFNSVKIINNSFSSVDGEGNPYFLPGIVLAPELEMLATKDKLIVAAAGNETNLAPAASPAGSPYLNDVVKNNVISVIGYNPERKRSDPDFLGNYTNLAMYAQRWSLAAPGTGLNTASSKGASLYETVTGTSVAAPLVSGSAAVVSSAFPYMGGKQLADVLFSTADKDYENFSKYMYQETDGKKQFLFFKKSGNAGYEWTEEEKEKKVREVTKNATATCSGGNISCFDVSYEDVFGQGLLNLGKAVKGPGYFDANRLSEDDYDGTQYLYSIDTKEYNSTWSNNIGQVKKDGNEANVGLKKIGSGELILSGQNSYLGETVVTEGSLRLRGSLKGNVNVSGGTFYLNGGSVPQVSVSSQTGKVSMNSGTMQNLINNNGEVKQSGGMITLVENKTDGTFHLSGGIVSTASNSGEFYLEGGTVSGKIQNTGTVQNNAVLSKNVVEGGKLINGEKGTLYLISAPDLESLPDTLENHGHIALSPSAENPDELQQMEVAHLNLAGGGFVLDANNVPRLREKSSYRILTATDTLTIGANFKQNNKLNQYLSAQAEVNETAKTVSLSLEYLPLAVRENSPTLSSKERKTASIVDRVFKKSGSKDLAGFYFFDESGLKKQINKMHEQTKPLRFSSLPLSGKLTRGVYTHIFERQRSKDPLRYEKRMQYYTPSSRQAPKGDIYRQFRPDNVSPQEYRYQVPKRRDVYQNFRPSGRSGGSGYAARNQVWGQAFIHDGTFDADKSAGSKDAKSRGTGLMFGWDFVHSNEFLWGLTTGYAVSSVEQAKDKTDITDLRFGAYFSRQKDFVSLDGALMIGHQNYDKTRMTVLPTDSYKSTASFGGLSLEASLNVGYDIQPLPMESGCVSMRPYIGVTAIQMMQDAYREKGSGDVGLGVKKMSDTSLTASPGVMLGFSGSEVNFLGYQTDYIFVDARYDYTFLGGKPKVKAYFSADTLQETFEVPAGSDKSAFSIGAGINGRLTNNTRLNLYFSQQTGSKSNVRSASLSMIYAF